MSDEKAVFEYERTGNVLVVVPTGSLIEFRDADIRNAYNDTYRYLDEDSIQHLLIDFSKLSYFGSTFIGMLIRLAKKARNGGGEAFLCNLSDNMKQMMKTLMLLENTKTDFFWVPFDSRQAALEALKGATNNSGDATQATSSTSPTETPSAEPPRKPDAPSSENDGNGGGGWSRFVN